MASALLAPTCSGTAVVFAFCPVPAAPSAVLSEPSPAMTLLLAKPTKTVFTQADMMSDSSPFAFLELPEQSDGRCCDFCFATSTPMWRRGPGGTGTLCNACGVRWSLKRSKPDAQEYVPEPVSRPVSKLLSRSIDRIPSSPLAEEPNKRTSPERDESAPPVGEVLNAVFFKRNEITGIDEEFYYCKYCNQQWPSSHFRNRQQFGAHCSNCSRKRKVGPFGPDEKMSPIPTRMRRKKKKSLTGSSSGLHDDLTDGDMTDSDSGERSTISASGSRDSPSVHTKSYYKQQQQQAAAAALELTVRDKLALLLTSAQLEMLRRDECTQRSELQKRLATLNAEIAQRRTHAHAQISALEMQLEKELTQLTSLATTQLTQMLDSLRAECATADALLEQLCRTQESFDRLLVSVRQIPNEPTAGQEETTISGRIAELEAAMGTLEGQLATLEAMYIERMQNVDRLRKAVLDSLESKAAAIEQMIEAHRSQLLRLLDSNRLVLLVIYFHLKSSTQV